MYYLLNNSWTPICTFRTYQAAVQMAEERKKKTGRNYFVEKRELLWSTATIDDLDKE